jgi:hypothetical protein
MCWPPFGIESAEPAPGAGLWRNRRVVDERVHLPSGSRRRMSGTLRVTLPISAPTAGY